MSSLPLFVGFSGFATNNADESTQWPFHLDIPPLTKIGDLLVASIETYGHIVPPGRGLTELYTHDISGGWSYGVWAGHWDGDTTPIAWSGTGFFNAVGQFFGAFVASFHNQLDPSRPIVKADGPTIPGLPGEGAAVNINWVRAALGGTAGYNPYGGTDWTAVGGVDGTYVHGTVGVNTGVISDETWLFAEPSGGINLPWPYLTFGVLPLGAAPPCRLYPREDQLGVGSGRIWPPPKSHQYSPRRAGGYY